MRLAGESYSFGKLLAWSDDLFSHGDFDGKVIFQHRMKGKWHPTERKHIKGFPRDLEARCFGFLDALNGHGQTPQTFEQRWLQAYAMNLEPQTTQDPGEAKAMWDRMQKDGVSVMVEVGAKFGATTHVLAGACQPYATIIAVDMPGGPGGDRSSADRLRSVVASLCSEGYDAHVVFGNSGDPRTVSEVVRLLEGRKVDLVFIDGDHSRAATLSDWHTYRTMVRPGGTVAMHDIAVERPGQEVRPVFKMLSETCDAEAIERNHGLQYGIGIIRLPQ